jgi:ryanodine receptor 2
MQELVQMLARNNHDYWAQQRFNEGWRLGPIRNDSRREHPNLVDYDNLPESEKDYDRKSVIETVKAIIALGYEINRR